MGTEEATSGHIIVNGTELGELSKMQLWDRIAYVPQNPILSAGQKQSLAIARALIRKPDILILDEATSNMDEMRERTVIQNLLQLEIPCVFVTHNSAIVQLMDEIVQVDKPF